MENNTNFIIGSNYFFKDFEGFESKDTDVIIMVDNLPETILNFKDKEKHQDVFLINNTSKKEILDNCLNSDLSMKAGKFLIPEFNEYIGFTIDDLKLLKEKFDNIDEKHKYEKVIYDAYIENNSFTLTDEQRKHAYDVYIESKNIIL